MKILKTKTMSVCSGLCGCEVSPSILSEINEVIGRMDTSTSNTDRVCQTPMWKRASSATRWPTEEIYNAYEKEYKAWPELKQALSGSNAENIIMALNAYTNAREALRSTLRERAMITSETHPDMVLKWAEQDRNSKLIGSQLKERELCYEALVDLVNLHHLNLISKNLTSKI